jgi:hypothetical protein
MASYKIKFTAEGDGIIIPEITNLGAVLGRLCTINADAAIMCDDVKAWGAPSECYSDVGRSHDKDEKAFHDSLAAEGVTLKMLEQAAADRGVNYYKAMQDCEGRIYCRDNPFT